MNPQARISFTPACVDGDVDIDIQALMLLSTAGQSILDAQMSTLTNSVDALSEVVPKQDWHAAVPNEPASTWEMLSDAADAKLLKLPGAKIDSCCKMVAEVARAVSRAR